MLRWVVGSSLKARGFVVAVAAAMVVFGAVQLRAVQVDTLPEFSPPTVDIQTEALGLSAPEVEQLITVPLEQDLLAGLPWLDTMRSASMPGLSSIELVFEPGTDLLDARQMVQERLTGATAIPNVSAPPQMLLPQSSTRRIMMVRVSSGSVSPIEMSVLARWTIRPRLLGVPGVANVSMWGFRDRQLQVQVDPEKLRHDGVSLDEVIETTGNALWASPLTFLEANTPGTGGFIDESNQRLGIQHLQPISTASDLAEVPLRGGAGTVRLGDVADVVEDHQPLIGDALFADGAPGILLAIDRAPGTSTLEVTRQVEVALDALRPGLPGIDVDTTVYRPATYIERSMRNLRTSLLIVLFILILALGALLFEWRSALVMFGSILASLTAAWLVLYLRGPPINTMVLAGLMMALAVVIDDAVSDVDHIVRRLRQRPTDGVEASGIVLDAVIEMRTTLTFATLIVLLTVVPLFFLQGLAAPFIPSMVLSFGLAVVSSMVVALTLTPALGLLLLRGAPLERRPSAVARWLQAGYDRLLAGTLRAPWRAYVGAGALVLVGLVALPFLSSSSLPSFRDGDVLVDLTAAPGTSLTEMDRITGRMETELAALPGVRNVGADVGRAITSDHVVDVDAAQLWVSVDPDSDYDATVSSVRAVVGGYPGIAHTVQTYSDERISAVLGQDQSPIVVRLFGQDLTTLQGVADDVMQAMDGIEGVVRPHVDPQPVEPTVDVTVDLQAAERYGIVPGDVRRTAGTLLSGLGVGSLFEQQKVFDVVVWGTPATRTSLSSVRDLLLDTPEGGQVRLGRIANVAIQSTPTVIRHQGNSRTIDVTADVQGRDVGAVAADVQDAIGAMSFPLEYHAELIGDDAEREATHLNAIMVGIAVAIGIFLLLQAAFGSWRLAAMSFLVLPLAGVGGVLALFASGRVLSLGALVGFFVVLAIGFRTGVAFIRRAQAMERDGDAASGPELVADAARERCMPVLTTAVVAALALLPFALSGGEAGQEIVHPMAIVVLGGLLTSVLLNLFVVPNLYLRFRPAAREPKPSGRTGPAPEVDLVAGI